MGELGKSCEVSRSIHRSGGAYDPPAAAIVGAAATAAAATPGGAHARGETSGDGASRSAAAKMSSRLISRTGAVHTSGGGGRRSISPFACRGHAFAQRYAWFAASVSRVGTSASAAPARLESPPLLFRANVPPPRARSCCGARDRSPASSARAAGSAGPSSRNGDSSAGPMTPSAPPSIRKSCTHGQPPHLRAHRVRRCQDGQNGAEARAFNVHVRARVRSEGRRLTWSSIASVMADGVQWMRVRIARANAALSTKGCSHICARTVVQRPPAPAQPAGVCSSTARRPPHGRTSAGALRALGQGGRGSEGSVGSVLDRAQRRPPARARPSASRSA